MGVSRMPRKKARRKADPVPDCTAPSRPGGSEACGEPALSSVEIAGRTHHLCAKHLAAMDEYYDGSGDPEDVVPDVVREESGYA